MDLAAAARFSIAEVIVEVEGRVSEKSQRFKLPLAPTHRFTGRLSTATAMQLLMYLT